MVLIAVPDEDMARRMADVLVGGRLAACVQIMPVTSVYRWEGQVEKASERLLFCKIVASDFERVERAIRSHHSYDVPEIVMLPIEAGHAPYLEWIGASTAR
jgi:periplasmic divalent cation tolerance protein